MSHPASHPGARRRLGRDAWQVLAIAGVAALALSACSNREGSANRRPLTGTATATAVNGVQKVVIDAGDDLRFHPSTIVVHPGKVEVVLHNTGNGAPHDFQLSIPADFVPLADAGQTKTATFTAPSPGTYNFVCTIHAAQGQRGKMIVLRH